MQTRLVFWITIVAMAATVMGFSPLTRALEGPSPVTMVGTALPCVTLAKPADYGGKAF
jgi:hypothetical protein